MNITVARVQHECPEVPIMTEGLVEPDRYWWGIIDDVRVRYCFNFCPYCGEKLPSEKMDA